jgi:choline-sulfatase
MNHNDNKPFLLVASLINPHDICYLPLLDWAKSENKPNPYPNKKAEQLINELLNLPEGMSKHDFINNHCPPLPENFSIPERELPSFTSNHTSSYIGWARRKYTENDWRIYRFLYARLTEIVDNQIGQLLDALKESGLEKNTLVVFTSDHGDQDASHQLGLKTFLYEESTNIPLVLKYPGYIRSGVINTENLVSNGLDLLPTLCDYAGIEIPRGLKGRSLKSLAAEKDSSGWRKSLVVETGKARLMVMDNQMKYMVETSHDGKQKIQHEMLFNLKSDPGEVKNIVSDNAFERFLRKGRKQLKSWFAENDMY